MKHRLILSNLFLKNVVLLVAPAIWTTCRDAKIIGLVFYNSLEKYKYFSLHCIRQCVYITFDIKRHVALPVVITAPWMRLVQSKNLN